MNLEPVKIVKPCTGEEVGKRLDLFLLEQLPEFSRTKIAGLIKNGKILVNGQTSKASYHLRAADTIAVFAAPQPTSPIQPENIPLEILYEDEYLLAINKKPGIVVHPGAGVRQGTLVSALLHYTDQLSSLGGRERPGLVHRLDKNTSGVLIVAKSDEVHWKMSRLFAERKVFKQYRAIVYGVPESAEGLIDAPLRRSQRNRQIFTVDEQGRPARTRFTVLKDYRIMAYLVLVLETGRTHQARVHLQSIGHPVVGDPVYGGKLRKGSAVSAKDVALLKKVQSEVQRQLLHAYLVRFRHPFLDEEIEIIAPLPDDFTRILNILEMGIEP
ncbi:MAG TPA: RluA family pseudouridine synthase [Candidatus Marinimicrobia bacterium]|nr:RluA family pseudouridine synthase [Candidatus Neomarinimicrobiota bacterium]HRS51488.1 RluA family pseudouridine synthase [Candidatus Neomarinimicrobiota bacterium]HRU92758.1 RluA family pseudouridine synthase [Candidatus Neomarinimicrobiota bacterium]